MDCLYHIIARPYTPAPLHEATSKRGNPASGSAGHPWQYATNKAQSHDQPTSNPASTIAKKRLQPPRAGVLCWLWVTIKPRQTNPAKTPLNENNQQQTNQTPPPWSHPPRNTPTQHNTQPDRRYRNHATNQPASQTTSSRATKNAENNIIIL